LVLIASSITAQHCLSEGIVFTRQSQIDSFSINYPGCTQIDGNLQISGEQSDIQSLIGLAQIQYIKGDLRVYGLDSVSNLDGLNQIDSIDGALRIEGNSGLLSCSGLNSLQHVKGLLNIQFNDHLQSLHGLDSLRFAESLRLWFNARLEDLTGLEKFDSVALGIAILSNYGLKSLQGLTKMDILHGDITIFDNDSLTTLSGLHNLQILFGSIWINKNSSLLSFEGLRSLKEIYGDFQVRESMFDSFENMDQLENIHGRFVVLENPNLQNFSGLLNLHATGELNFNENPILTSLSGLDGMRKLGIIQILNNPSLTDISSLIHVSHSTGYVRIKGNTALHSLFGLDSLTLTSMNFIEISQNDQLSQCAVASICNHLYNAGNYSIDFNAPGCNTREEIINDCLTPTIDPTAQNEIIVYPNPTHGILHINGLTNTNINVAIRDLHGRFITSLNLTSNVLNIGDLAEGMYILTFTKEDVVVNQKVIRN